MIGNYGITVFELEKHVQWSEILERNSVFLLFHCVKEKQSLKYIVDGKYMEASSVE